jgi:uncharacterized iron-regulated membrane protein
MNVRKILFCCHLTIGRIAGVVIFMMCVTGVLLAFSPVNNSIPLEN